jgi:RimJ/RimL family protein N-acetyltransferase
MDAADAAAVLAVWGDPAVMCFMARPPLADLSAARAFIAEIDTLAAAGSLYQWGIELAEERDPALVGTVTLVMSDARHQTADLGFALRRDRWGQGIVSRAAALAVAHAFGALGVHRLQADCDPRNPGSLRVLEKLGFVREGVMRQRYLQMGERQDAVLLSLLRPSS